jgi:hypothetical protein
MSEKQFTDLSLQIFLSSTGIIQSVIGLFVIDAGEYVGGMILGVVGILQIVLFPILNVFKNPSRNNPKGFR